MDIYRFVNQEDLCSSVLQIEHSHVDIIKYTWKTPKELKLNIQR